MGSQEDRELLPEAPADSTVNERAGAVAGPAAAVLALQRSCGNRAVGRMVATQRNRANRPVGHTDTAPGPRRAAGRLLQRLYFDIGNVRVDIDYGGLSAVADPAAEIASRYAAYTGGPAPAGIVSAVAALSAAGRRWVMYGLSVLQRNAAAAPGLNRADAVRRLVDRAPSATTSPTSPGLDFENEVLRVSGWAESALVAPLTAPTGGALATIRGLFNPPTSSGSASSPLDAALLNAELPPALTTLLNSLDPANWTNVGTASLGTLQTIADEIQREARAFFAPYSDTAMSSPYASGWQYSSQLFSVTAMTPTRDQRIGYLLNRAEIVGRRAAPGGSIFERTNFESSRDAPALLAIVTTMEADAAIAAVVDRLIRHTGRTQRNPLRVGISTEWNLDAASECETRWRNILTLSHELCHALVHPNFPAQASSVRFGQIIREGFTEVLGIQLYRHLRAKAGSDAAFKGRMEAGVGGAPCAAPPPGTIGYGEAGPAAETIRTTVGDDNFRAAYFLGAVNLVGL